MSGRTFRIIAQKQDVMYVLLVKNKIFINIFIFVINFFYFKYIFFYILYVNLLVVNQYNLLK